jgi:hypothetical protein
MTNLGGRAMESLDRQFRVLPNASNGIAMPVSPVSDGRVPPDYSITHLSSPQMLENPANTPNSFDRYPHEEGVPPVRLDSFEPSILTASDPESFDLFLDNFPDVNFSCAASDQLFWDFET